MKKLNKGKCSICGRECNLSFEHIPPRAAFNSFPLKSISGDSFIKLVTSKNRKPWDIEGLKYENLQRGSGLYSLCQECNNYTGTMYGTEYVKIARDLSIYLSRESNLDNATMFEAKIKEFYPLRFIKQVLSMFCSTTSGLVDSFPIIKDALLNKDILIENPDFNIYMFVLKNQRISWAGANAVAIKGSNEPLMISELVAYPFGFVFDYDDKLKDNYKMLSISSFLSYKYDEQVEMMMVVPMHERNMPFPLDFRTKSQFEKSMNE